jgi:hypothetical protein
VLILCTHGFWIEGHEKTDYWKWTVQGLDKIFKESGFDVIESHSMESYPSFFQFVSLFIPAKPDWKTIPNIYQLKWSSSESAERENQIYMLSMLLKPRKSAR